MPLPVERSRGIGDRHAQHGVAGVGWYRRAGRALGVIAGGHPITGGLDDGAAHPHRVDADGTSGLASRKRQRPGLVLQQHDGLPLGEVGLLLEGGPSDDRRGTFGIHVRVLEQTEQELLAEQPCDRLIDARLGHAAARDEAEDFRVGAEARQHVHPCVDRRDELVLLRPAFHAPRSGRARRADDAGVGVHVAREAELAAQEIGHDAFRERHAHVVGLVALAHRNAVVGHDRRGACVDGGLERAHVVVEPSRGIHLVPAEVVMRVATALLGAGTREVLDRDGHAVGAEPRALQPRHHRADDVDGQIGVFRERLVIPIPAGFGGEVGHVAVEPADADGSQFLANGGCKLGHEVEIARGRESRFFRPDREGARGDVDARPGVLLVVAPRVGLEQHRDAQSRAFGQRLYLVGEAGGLGRGHLRTLEAPRRRFGTRHHRVTEDEARHVLVADEGGRRRRERAPLGGIERLDEHHPGLFGRRHTTDEVAHPLVHGPPPVFVRIQRAAGVEVAEALAVHDQDRLHACDDQGVGRLPDEARGRAVTHEKTVVARHGTRAGVAGRETEPEHGEGVRQEHGGGCCDIVGPTTVRGKPARRQAMSCPWTTCHTLCDTRDGAP